MTFLVFPDWNAGFMYLIFGLSVSELIGSGILEYIREWYWEWQMEELWWLKLEFLMMKGEQHLLSVLR